MQLRLVVEVHAVDADQEGQRQEDHADHGQSPHDLVGAMADDRHVEVDRVGQDLARHQHVLEHALDGADHVGQERLGRLADEP